MLASTYRASVVVGVVGDSRVASTCLRLGLGRRRSQERWSAPSQTESLPVPGVNITITEVNRNIRSSGHQ